MEVNMASVEEARESADNSVQPSAIDANVDITQNAESLANAEDERGRRLVEAAKIGNVDLAKRLIDSGAPLSAIDDDNRRSTVLHCTAIHDNVEIAEMLLAKDKSLVNALDISLCTPLHLAAWFGRDKMCRLLFHHKGSLTTKNNRNRTAHYALANGSWNVNMLAWLLSMSSQPASYFTAGRSGHGKISTYLCESSRMGYVDLVQKLLKDGGADPLEGDDEGKTALHYAVEGTLTLDQEVAFQIIQKLVDGGADPFQGDHDGKTALHYAVEGALDVEVAFQIIERLGGVNWEKARAGNKIGRNFFHAAAFLGKEDLCGKLLDRHRDLMDTKDRDGRTPIFYAVDGPHNDPRVLELLISRAQGTSPIFVKDFSQTTLLHVASARGNPAMVDIILAKFSSQGRMSWVQATNDLGQTALHKAASGGHCEVVEKLLANGAHPFEERDYEGKTALHFAAEADRGEDAVKIAELLLGKCESEDQRTLLLFASTVGIGLPNSSLLLRDYLEKERSNKTEPKNVLRVAATFGDIDSTIACITRGANIALIRNEQWRANLPTEKQNNVRDVLKQIKTIVEQGTDKPALQDYLGRSPYAIGLAAFFLNPFMGSPITVGISGEWGMGKSSVMLQTETILLNTAAELAFSKSFQEDSGRASESQLSGTGRVRLREIANAIDRLDAKSGDGPNIIDNIGMCIEQVKNFISNVHTLPTFID